MSFLFLFSSLTTLRQTDKYATPVSPPATWAPGCFSVKFKRATRKRWKTVELAHRKFWNFSLKIFFAPMTNFPDLVIRLCFDIYSTMGVFSCSAAFYIKLPMLPLTKCTSQTWQSGIDPGWSYPYLYCQLLVQFPLNTALLYVKSIASMEDNFYCIEVILTQIFLVRYSFQCTKFSLHLHFQCAFKNSFPVWTTSSIILLLVESSISLCKLKNVSTI